MNKGFIAAPLLGTMMFLIATVFVVGLVSSESQEVNRATVDAYHNKLVSVLELYRLDLYSLFVDGLRQNVEDFLAGIPWVNLNSVSENSPNARFENCFEMKKAIRSQIVSSGSTFDVQCYLSGLSSQSCSNEGSCVTGHGSDNSCPNNQAGRKCICNGGGTFLNGLSDLLKALRQAYNFEGVSFMPVAFTGSDFDCSANSVDGALTGRALCEYLIPRVEFDCNNFASNPASPYRCCNAPQPTTSLGPDSGTCPSANIVMEGCDNGAFLMAVALDNGTVFRYMPRIDAADGAGNEIRSGALGEKPIDMRIRYPIFKYRHISFEFFSHLQYEGYPANKQRCKTIAQDFAANLIDACNYLNGLKISDKTDPKYADLSANVSLSSGTSYVRCDPSPGANAKVECCVKSSNANDQDGACAKGFVHEDGSHSYDCSASNAQEVAEFVRDQWSEQIVVRTPNVEFYDNDARFRVNPQKPNTYSWDAELTFPDPGSPSNCIT